MCASVCVCGNTPVRTVPLYLKASPLIINWALSCLTLESSPCCEGNHSKLNTALFDCPTNYLTIMLTLSSTLWNWLQYFPHISAKGHVHHSAVSIPNFPKHSPKERKEEEKKNPQFVSKLFLKLWRQKAHKERLKMWTFKSGRWSGKGSCCTHWCAATFVSKA